VAAYDNLTTIRAETGGKRERYFFPSLFAISMERAAVWDTPFGRKAYAESALAFLPSAAGEIVVDIFHIVNQLTHAVNLNE
jgi:hypothetical protein